MFRWLWSLLSRGNRGRNRDAELPVSVRPRVHDEVAPRTPPSEKFIKAWRAIIIGDHKSWVLFQRGTCVILMKPEPDLRTQAIELLREWGPVHPGSPAGDFSVMHLTAHPGWSVTCHHKDILTYVAPEELPPTERNDVAIGLFGRAKRQQDSTDLKVIHVEDKRSVA